MIIPTPPPSPPPWSLHPQLARDTVDLGELPLARVLVVNDANWPWLLLVPRRAGIREIIDLDEVEQAQLMTEITRTARASKRSRNATSSTSRRSAMRCRSCTSTSSPAAKAMPAGRARSGAQHRQSPMKKMCLSNLSRVCASISG